MCGHFDIILDHFSRLFLGEKTLTHTHAFPALRHATRAVSHVLPSARADRVLAGACNPMLCPPMFCVPDPHLQVFRLCALYSQAGLYMDDDLLYSRLGLDFDHCWPVFQPHATPTRRVLCSTECPCSMDADWRFRTSPFVYYFRS